MRTQILISSFVATVLATMAQADVVFDSFTQTSSAAGSQGVFNFARDTQTGTFGLFNTRTIEVADATHKWSAASTGGGTAHMGFIDDGTADPDNPYGASGIFYKKMNDLSLESVDFTTGGLNAFAFKVSNFVNKQPDSFNYVGIQVSDGVLNGFQSNGLAVFGNGVITLCYSDFSGTVDWTHIIQCGLIFGNSSGTSENVGSVDISDFVFTKVVPAPVPAPGAAALIGLVGLVAGRRRRNSFTHSLRHFT